MTNNPSKNAEKGIKGAAYVVIAAAVRGIAVKYLGLDEIAADGAAAFVVAVIMAAGNYWKHRK